MSAAGASEVAPLVGRPDGVEQCAVEQAVGHRGGRDQPELGVAHRAQGRRRRAPGAAAQGSAQCEDQPVRVQVEDGDARAPSLAAAHLAPGVPEGLRIAQALEAAGRYRSQWPAPNELGLVMPLKGDSERQTRLLYSNVATCSAGRT